MRKPGQHTEIVLIAIPVLAEAVVVGLAIAVGAFWILYFGGRI